MDDDPRLENMQLRETVDKIRRVCAKHREMEENTASENRDLRRKIDSLKQWFDLYKTETNPILRDSAFKKVEEILTSL